MKLRHIVTEVLKTSLLTEPRDLATEVLARIDPEDVAEALAQAMPVFVRQVLSEQRQPTCIRPSTTSTGSVRIAAIRDDWKKALRDRIKTDDGMKFLGDCTIADLEAAARLRDEMAERNRAKAAQYRVLIHELEDAGVNRVKDLPTQRMMLVFGQAA